MFVCSYVKCMIHVKKEKRCVTIIFWLLLTTSGTRKSLFLRQVMMDSDEDRTRLNLRLLSLHLSPSPWRPSWTCSQFSHGTDRNFKNNKDIITLDFMMHLLGGMLHGVALRPFLISLGFFADSFWKDDLIY